MEPNPGFLAQLRRYEDELASRRTPEDGAAEAAPVKFTSESH